MVIAGSRTTKLLANAVYWAATWPAGPQYSSSRIPMWVESPALRHVQRFWPAPSRTISLYDTTIPGVSVAAATGSANR